MDSDSDSDELFESSWTLSKRRKILSDSHGATSKRLPVDCKKNKLAEQAKKFEELRTKSSHIKQQSSIRLQKTEVRRSEKLIRKALKDPWIKAAVEDDKNSVSNKISNEKEELESVKPFLFINKHLQGPIPHGDCGPKTELEYQIEDCIKEVEIANAFAAKKYKEKQDELKALEEQKKKKKFRWLFDAKEKWQMKGNM